MALKKHVDATHVVIAKKCEGEILPKDLFKNNDVQ